MKFRKKPVVIEAVQWIGDNFSEISELVTLNPKCYAVLNGEVGLQVGTLDGALSEPVPIGHWIIAGVQGEIHPCAPDIFAETYEPAEEPVFEEYV